MTGQIPTPMLQVHIQVLQPAAVLQAPIPAPAIPETMLEMQTPESSIMPVAAVLMTCLKEIKYFSQIEMMR